MPDSPTPSNQDQSDRKKSRVPRNGPWVMVFWIAMIFVLFMLFSGGLGGDSDNLTLRDLDKHLDRYEVKEVYRKAETIYWEVGEGAPEEMKKKNPQQASIAYGEKVPDDLKKKINDKVKDGGYRVIPPDPFVRFLENYGFLIIIALLFYFFFIRSLRTGGGGNIFSFGKSRATLVKPENIQKTFKDVAGVDEAKEELHEIVQFLKDPDRFTKLGGRLPRGVLLHGPPGTGKTLLAKAIAGEAGVPYYTISGSDFVEMFVGVGASRVRDLFNQAKENSPSIIFLDEIDAVGRQRGSGMGGGHDEREQTLNAILVEMDGFESDEGVIVIASTNRLDVLDPALLRPGRFDRHVAVPPPDIEGRKEILKVHSKKIKLSAEVNLDIIAQSTTRFTGADLENLLNEAALIAVAGSKNAIDMHDLYNARDKIAYGKARKKKVVHEDDLRITAYHEAGHAIASLNVNGSQELEKVTIIPIGYAAGANFFRPTRDDEHMSKNKLIAEIMICYGGRAAEEIFFDDITAGASNDIKQATNIGRRMVTEWGMSETTGLINYTPSEERVFIGGEISKQQSYSEATAQVIDREVQTLLDQCYQDTKAVIEKEKDALIRIAEALLVYESLTGEEVKDLAEGKALTREPPVTPVITRITQEDIDAKANGQVHAETEEEEKVEVTTPPASETKDSESDENSVPSS